MTYKIKVKIIKIYKAKYNIGNEIEFYKTIEEKRDNEGINPFINKKLIISFIYKGNQLIIPEVAYDFDYSEELNAMFEGVVKNDKKTN